MREKYLIISKLCVDLTFYITLCCVVACLFFALNQQEKRDKLMQREVGTEVMKKTWEDTRYKVWKAESGK